MEQPNVYIKTVWEKREGFRYDQPFNYVNNIKLTLDVLSNFKKNFGVSFSEAQKESIAYNNALSESKYNSEFWNNDEAKNKAFSKIFQFNLVGRSKSGSSITPLLPFEIYMMNDGFEMISFCELNAIDPGVIIVADGFVNDCFINPKGLQYKRCYIKEGYFIYLAFGIEINNKKTNFYFQTNKSHKFFQVDNDYVNYLKSINGELTPLEDIQNI